MRSSRQQPRDKGQVMNVDVALASDLRGIVACVCEKPALETTHFIAVGGPTLVLKGAFSFHNGPIAQVI